jgi:acetyl-CoA carboxylase carboxyltransferase component
MAINKKIKELQEKREKLFRGGGELAIEKQKALGKRTARERIMALLDEGSFNEYDLFVEHDARDFDMDKKSLPTDGVIIGSGTIYGAPVAIFAQDFTVAGGSLGLMQGRSQRLWITPSR